MFNNLLMGLRKPKDSSISKITTNDEQRNFLFGKMIDNDVDAVRQLPIGKMDLNFFEPIQQLAFLDDRVTPLIYCSSLGKPQIARILLTNPTIDTDLQTPTNKQTPLISACMGVNYQMVKLLLDGGAQVNKPNNFNQTPLVVTVHRLLEQYNSFELKRICMKILSVLVSKGADVNWIVDKQKGYTLLHMLCANSGKMSKSERQINFEIIKFLIENGSDISMRAFNGKKPEELVVGHCGMTAIMDFIIKFKTGQENIHSKPTKLPLKKHTNQQPRELFQLECQSPKSLECSSPAASIKLINQPFSCSFLSINKLRKR